MARSTRTSAVATAPLCRRPRYRHGPAPAEIGISAINTYQLHRIGKDVANVKQAVDAIGENVNALMTATNHLVGLATGTMLLSGLTLGVSTAGFAFLNRKLNKIDEKLQQLQKDVREIKDFLNTRQRAELTTALNTMRDVSDAPSDDTRRQLLVHSRQTLGTLHHHYKIPQPAISRVRSPVGPKPVVSLRKRRFSAMILRVSYPTTTRTRSALMSWWTGWNSPTQMKGASLGYVLVANEMVESPSAA